MPAFAGIGNQFGEAGDLEGYQNDVAVDRKYPAICWVGGADADVPGHGPSTERWVRC
jgi:hypothetical protein